MSMSSLRAANNILLIRCEDGMDKMRMSEKNGDDEHILVSCSQLQEKTGTKTHYDNIHASKMALFCRRAISSILSTCATIVLNRAHAALGGRPPQMTSSYIISLLFRFFDIIFSCEWIRCCCWPLPRCNHSISTCERPLAIRPFVVAAAKSLCRLSFQS